MRSRSRCSHSRGKINDSARWRSRRRASSSRTPRSMTSRARRNRLRSCRRAARTPARPRTRRGIGPRQEPQLMAAVGAADDAERERRDQETARHAQPQKAGREPDALVVQRAGEEAEEVSVREDAGAGVEAGIARSMVRPAPLPPIAAACCVVRTRARGRSRPGSRARCPCPDRAASPSNLRAGCSCARAASPATAPAPGRAGAAQRTEACARTADRACRRQRRGSGA